MTQPLPNASKHTPTPLYAEKLMDETGLRQFELAQVAGVSTRTLRQYKSAGRDYLPMPYSVQYLLEALVYGRRDAARRRNGKTES